MPKHPHVPDFVFTGPFLSLANYPIGPGSVEDWQYVCAMMHPTMAQPYFASYLPFDVFQVRHMDAGINAAINWCQFEPGSGKGAQEYSPTPPVKDACESYRTQWVAYMKSIGH